MTKYFAAVLIALAAAPQNVSPPAGSPRNLWIGVIIDDVYSDYELRTGPKMNANLEPVAAFVAGKWWVKDARHTELDADRSDTPGLGWLPRGTELPSRWDAHLFDGRRVSVRTPGPLRQTEPYERYGATTDLAFPRRSPADDHEFENKGVASTGNLNLQLFADIPERSREQLLRFLAPSMLQADREEISTRAREMAGVPGVAPGEVRKRLLDRLDLASLVVDTARWASYRGESFYVIEGGKALGTDDTSCTGTWTGAAARKDRAGRLHVMAAWSYLVCNELHVDHFALALLERDGESCWLSARLYEDGVERVLTRPGQLAEEKPTCGIK